MLKDIMPCYSKIKNILLLHNIKSNFTYSSH